MPHRVSLRAPQEADFALLSQLRNDVALQVQLLATPQPNDEQRVRAWLARRQADPHGVFFVVAECETDGALGFVQIVAIDRATGHGKVGIALAEGARGQGFGGEALALLEVYARETLGLSKLLLEVMASNAPAVALYERSGYARVALHPAQYVYAGTPYDVAQMEKHLATTHPTASTPPVSSPRPEGEGRPAAVQAVGLGEGLQPFSDCVPGAKGRVSLTPLKAPGRRFTASLSLRERGSMEGARGVVVVSQPMFFPWVGMLEQIRLAEVYVHYDDVAFSKGSFTNRVQIKGPLGSSWLTVPLKGLTLGQPIRDVEIDERQPWRRKHLAVLAQFYDRAPYRDDMLALVQEVYDRPLDRLGALAIASLAAVCRYLAIADPDTFRYAADLDVPGHGSERVLGIVRHLDGTRYVTGHGARHYLDHESFEKHGIDVAYMAYARTPYPQLHGAFNPHVSSLDLIANMGRDGLKLVTSPAVSWRTFLTS